MKPSDKQFKKIADRIGMTPSELINKIHVVIHKKREKDRKEQRQKDIDKATSRPYPKRDLAKVRIRKTKD